LNRRILFIWLCSVASGVFALASIVRAEPVAHWDFGSEETSRLVAHGGVHRDVPGPRPPEFPDFDPNNTAVKFDGSGAHYSFADSGKNSPLDFDNGDAITLEAWVDMADIKEGENLYIVGKGRTDDPGFAKDNQNWALRVREVGGRARASFLFATPIGEKPGARKDAHWHRWTATDGFTPGSGWHHLAVSYRFGEPESIRSWLDGRPTNGAWDMGGPTREAPVVDDDAVWIGSSMGGKAANSFRGVLDEIAIYRELVPDEIMRTRYRREGQTAPTTVAAEVAPVISAIPPGRVRVTFHEGLPSETKWPASEAVPPQTMQWLTESFAIPRLPMRYDDWGIRQAWKGPVLIRAAADIQLPAGTQHFLLRARGLTRLWVNGKVIARSTRHSGSSDGYQPIPPVPAPPLPGMRPVGYGDQEVFGDATIGADGHCHAVLEAVVGGKKIRPEPGEMCVAVQTPDGKSFVLLQPQGEEQASPLTDRAWDATSAKVETELTELDDANRRAAAASQDDFWQKRHALARKWVMEHPGPAVPAVKDNGAHPIDAFLTGRVERAVAAAAGPATPAGTAFQQKVLPVLSDQCFRCHGEKHKGGVRFNSREAILQAGDSGKPAVLPGDPAHSQILARLRSADPDERMPPKGDGLAPDQIAAIEAWIKAGAPWPATPVLPAEVAVPPIVNDSAFLRRAYLDCVGVPPTDDQAKAFLADAATDKRTRLIDRLLADPRFADHWVSYWQDVLAENPSMLKPSLNNSGPFRWFLYEALRDGKPMDRMVSELVLLRGGSPEGGSAGFGVAADNDAPLAAKGQVIGGAFLGIELQCARCHDAPFHSSKQRDLYAVSAMLNRKSVTVPKTSRVPAAFFEKKARESLIKVTLKPDEPIAPIWPFEKTCGIGDNANLDTLLHDPKDTRERLAALITAPQNQRFAQVLVNRVWKRLVGAGFVEPAHDWEGHAASHPELLDWLAREFVAHDYDLKYVVRLIMTSQMYEREPTGENFKMQPEHRFFVAPDRRRLTAEQVVDSLFSASGRPMQVEELTFDPDGRNAATTMISLGKPCRSWMFASLSNERDRPSLSLPRAQAVTDVLEAFGWTGARQSPRTDRETDVNVLQPGVLENSVMCSWVIRASVDSGLAQLAVDATSPDELVDAVFLRFLARLPDKTERARFSGVLSSGFSDRLVPPGDVKPIPERPRLPRVSWSNHLVAEANVIKVKMERNARAGDPPDPRLSPEWRETYEDFVWGVINSPEFVWVP
jgi:cytochrome c553